MAIVGEGATATAEYPGHVASGLAVTIGVLPWNIPVEPFMFRVLQCTDQQTEFLQQRQDQFHCPGLPGVFASDDMENSWHSYITPQTTTDSPATGPLAI